MSSLYQKFSWRWRVAAQGALMRRSGLSHTLPSGLRVDVESPADWTIYNDIFVDAEYDRPINFALARKDERPLNVLDLGANVGFFTLRLSDAWLRQSQPRRDLRVTLVEGSSRTAGILDRRLSSQAPLRGLYKIVHGLAGKREGTAVLHETAYHGMTSLAPRRFSRRSEVPFVDLSKLMRDVDAIDLLKCDIEGAEQLVLETYADLFKKTSAAVFELHHTQIDHAKCLAMLREFGLTHHEVLHKRPNVTTEYFSRQGRL